MTLVARTIVADAEEKVGREDGEKHLHRNLEALVAALNADGTLTPAAALDDAPKSHQPDR